MQRTWQIRYSFLLGMVFIVLVVNGVLAVLAGQTWAIVGNAIGLVLFLSGSLLMYREGLHRLQQQRVLFEHSRDLATQQDLDDLLDHIVRSILRVIPLANKCVIHLLDSSGRRLYPRYASEFSRQRLLGMPANKGIAGQALRECRTIVVPDVRREPEFLPLHSSADLRALMVAPLSAQGTLLGTISLNSKAPKAFDAQDKLVFSGLAAQASTAIYQSQLYNANIKTQQQTEAILNSISDGLLVLGSDNQIQRYNLSVQQLLGLERDQQLEGKVEPDSSHELLRGLAAILALHPADARQTREYQMTIAQPTRTHLVVTVSAALDRNKDWIKIVTLHDKTDTLTRLDTWANLLRATTYALRGPLAVIRGYATLLASQIAPSETPTPDWGQQMREQSARLMRLCDDLADLCAIEGQTFERRPAPVAIGALLSEATDLVGSAARRQQVRIETRYAPNLPSLMLDQERLRRVLVHLIENALRRALPGGQISIKIEVSLEELTCTLADDGQPLSMDERARVFFGPFQLADHALADSDDSGLELYLSRRIIEAEKGHLWTPEEDDRGPRFQLIVPLTAA